MTATPRHVDPWTSPVYLMAGDRADNPGSLTVEWDGSEPVPVCPSDDIVMTDWTGTAERCCPACGMTASEALNRARRP